MCLTTSQAALPEGSFPWRRWLGRPGPCDPHGVSVSPPAELHTNLGRTRAACPRHAITEGGNYRFGFESLWEGLLSGSDCGVVQSTCVCATLADWKPPKGGDGGKPLQCEVYGLPEPRPRGLGRTKRWQNWIWVPVPCCYSRRRLLRARIVAGAVIHWHDRTVASQGAPKNKKEGGRGEPLGDCAFLVTIWVLHVAIFMKQCMCRAGFRYAYLCGFVTLWRAFNNAEGSWMRGMTAERCISLGGQY
jgi:hypothetical protein